VELPRQIDRMKLIAPIFALIALLTAATGARADDERDFCAQRPGKATPPCVLDEGRAQIEVGLADAVFQRSGGVHQDTYTLSAAELRVGISPRVEIEAAWSPVVINATRGSPRQSGTGDASLGVLAALTDPNKMGVAVSAQGFVTLPTATHGLGAGGWTAGVRLPMAIPLSDGFSLGLTPEVDVLRNAGGGGTHAAWTGVGSLGRAFGALSVGVELWGQVEDDPAGTIRRASADLTAAYMIGKNLQLDAGANFGLNHATPSTEVYVGISHRF
jgi:Putative MetA-pathway of phenol degradation